MKKFMKSIFMVLGFAFVLSFASCSNGSSDDNNIGNGNETVVLYSGTPSSNKVTTLVADYELDDYTSGYLYLEQEWVSGDDRPGYFMDDKWVADVWNSDTENSRLFKVEDWKGHSLGYNPYGASYKVTVVYSPTLQ